MQQIAVAAGVSRMTVSLALRDHPRISAGTRARIHQIAENLGYRPDPEVSKLMAHLRRARRTRHRSTLGLITMAGQPEPWKFNRHFAKFHEGATHRAEDLGYRIEEFWLKEPGLTSKRLTKILETRSIDGLLIGPTYREAGHLSIQFGKFAVAEHGQNVWRPRIHRADHNQFQGMLLAMRHLQRLHYRRIGLVLLQGFDRRTIHTWEGAFHYSQQRRAGNEHVPPLIAKALDKAAFMKWFHEHRPDAVISSHLEVKDWLAALKLRTPEDVGFVFLDWLDKTDRCAGINQHYEVIAAAAVDLVVGQIQSNERGVPRFPKLVLIEGEWVDGPTVRKQK